MFFWASLERFAFCNVQTCSQFLLRHCFARECSELNFMGYIVLVSAWFPFNVSIETKARLELSLSLAAN
jgi:hypothetical protein